MKRVAILETKGRAKATVDVYETIHAGNHANNFIDIKYLEALEKVVDENSTKIFLSTEVSGILVLVGGISKLFN